MAKKNQTAVAVFNTRERADAAVEDLIRSGYDRDQISVVARDADGKVRSEGGDTYAEEGATAGVVAGAGVAGLASLGMSFGVIPVIGPVLAVGPIVAALLSAAGGAAAAGLTGWLIGSGIPEEDAAFYEGAVKSGRYLVTVQGAKRDEAFASLRKSGGYDHASASAEDRKLEVVEEQLHARKQKVRAGEVTVRKEVTTETKSIDVPVEREEVVIERRAAGGRVASGDLKPGEVIRVPVSEERVTVQKTPVVTEEVTVGKRKVHETEHVSDTVKKEKVKVEKTGDVKVKGDGRGSKG